MKQMWYMRGESRFSDHRPVYSLFLVRVNVPAHEDVIRPDAGPPGLSCTIKPSTTAATGNGSIVVPSTCMAKVQAEELLPLTRAQSCVATTPRFGVYPLYVKTRTSGDASLPGI